MKKHAFSLFIFCNIYAFTALSQTPLPASKPVKTGNEWKMPTDALTRSKAFSDSLKTALSLDDATAKKVFNAYLANTKSVDEIAVTFPKEDDKKNALKANRLKFDLTLKDILSPAQFEGYRKWNLVSKKKR